MAARQSPLRAMVFVVSIALTEPVRAGPDDQEAITGAAGVVVAARAREDFCLNEELADARGLIVLSNVVSVAAVFGGQGGRGVFLQRDTESPWSNPSFVRLNALTFGFQIGGEALDVLAVLNAEVAQKLAAGRMKLTAGADASVVAGQKSGSATNLSNVGPGIRYFIIDSSGFFAGAKLSGAKIRIDDDANERFYTGANTKPFDASAATTPEQAAALIAELSVADPSGCAPAAPIPAG